MPEFHVIILYKYASGKKLTKDHQEPYLDKQPFIIIIISSLFWFEHLRVLDLHGMWNMIS